MTEQINPERKPHGGLSLRLTVPVLLAAFAVIAGGTYIDHRREYKVHLNEMADTLREEAYVIQLTREKLADQAAFAEYVHDFCAHMDKDVSPGHHVLVLSKSGEILAQGRQTGSHDRTQRLLATPPGQRIVPFNGRDMLQFRMKDTDGSTIIVAEFLDPLDDLLASQLISRAINAAVMALAVTLLIFLAVNRWVLTPILQLLTAARAWSGRDFGARAKPSGPEDLRVLADEFNSMAGQLERYEQARLREMDHARQIQRNLLPADTPAAPGLAIAAEYRPMDQVAGDLYDVFPLSNGRTAIAILDVAGHGISAALLTGVVKMSLHRRLAEREDLSAALQMVNRDLLTCVSNGQFVSVLVGVWENDTRSWSYASAGHPGGMLATGGEIRTLPSTGPLLGIEAKMQWTQNRIHLCPGDRLLLYTDGVEDSGLPKNRLGQQGLEELVRASLTMSVKEQARYVMDQALGRAPGPPADDATMIAVEVTT